MNISKRLISLVLCVILLCAVCVGASAKTLFKSADFYLEKINNDTEFQIDSFAGDDSFVFTLYSHNNIPVTSIGDSAFSGNTNITTIWINQSITNIGKHAFLNCSNLAEVKFNYDITKIGTGAFSGCTKLSSIALEETSITVVSDNAFANCDSLTQVTLPDTATKLCDYSFAYMDNLTKIVIPKSVTTIEEHAFYNSDKVVIYCYRDTEAEDFARSMSIPHVLLDDDVVDPPRRSYMLGDADGDGVISITDATTIQLLLAYLIEDPDGGIAVRGDVDFDILSIMDATYIQMYLAKYQVPCDIGGTYYYD